MQQVGSALLAILQSSSRDLAPIDLFEFYEPDETDLCPANAVKRYAATPITWLGWDYEQEALSRGDVSRYYGTQFNSVSLTLSNIDREVGTWLSTTAIEGYRVLIRCISRSVDDDSNVLGVFRCDKAFDVDNKTVQINAKQDLGSIDNDLPWDEYSSKCSAEFKDAECLAGQALGSKSAAYQAATTCNKSWRQCQDDYANGKAFKAARFNGISGNFRVSQRRGGAGGALLGLIGLGNKRVTKQYSSQDSTPYGQAIVLGLGRTQLELQLMKSADTGEYLAGQWDIGEGELTKILNLRNVSSGWATSFQSYFEHLGKYGYETDQWPLGFFASDFDHHSHRGYVEITIRGDNPDTGDPAPSIVAVILWIKIPTWTGSSFGGASWSDNGVEHTRFLLTEARGLAYSEDWIDDVVAGETVEYCNEPMVDQSGSEDVYVSSASGTPGTDYKRYRSTGLLDTWYFRKVLGLTSNYSAEREVTYNTYTSGSSLTITPSTYYRKRYTSNFHIRERVRTTDFILKQLLPSFRGYLLTSAQGKLQIKAEKPTITSYLRNSASAGATAIQIEDALAWKNLNLPVIYVLVGVDEATSETRRVTSIDFSTAGNSITLSASGSATASGSTLSGGTTTIQAQATVTIGSAATATVVIDGVSLTYTANGNDTTGTIAAMIATMVNANLTLNRYVKATWSPTNPTVVIIRSKLGTLNLASGLTSSHDALEIAAHVHMPFSDVAFGALARGNIIKDSFKWPNGSKQSSYNQFTLTFNDAVNDFQPTKLVENDKVHQRKINKTNQLEISGSCVDNYHQADRLVKAARYKHREGDFFVTFASAGMALLLEEGDVICVNHSNMPNKRNLLCRIEELKVGQNHRVMITARLYADAQFPTSAEERTISPVTGVGWVSTPPGAVTSLVVTSPASGTIAGTFSFAAYVGSQQARIEIKRAGESDFSDTGIRVSPDTSSNGAFEISGLPVGTTYVRVTPFSSAGDGPSTEGAWGGGYGEDYGGSYGG